MHGRLGQRLGRGAATGEQLDVGAQDAFGFVTAFTHELHAEPPHPTFQQPRHQRCCALGLCVEDRVATADVDDDRVIQPLAIAQGDLLLLARSAAGLEVSPVGEQVCVDAVLGVEGRDVVVQRSA